MVGHGAWLVLSDLRTHADASELRRVGTPRIPRDVVARDLAGGFLR